MNTHEVSLARTSFMVGRLWIMRPYTLTMPGVRGTSLLYAARGYPPPLL